MQGDLGRAKRNGARTPEQIREFNNPSEGGQRIAPPPTERGEGKGARELLVKKKTGKDKRAICIILGSRSLSLSAPCRVKRKKDPGRRDSEEERRKKKSRKGWALMGKRFRGDDDREEHGGLKNGIWPSLVPGIDLSLRKVGWADGNQGQRKNLERQGCLLKDARDPLLTSCLRMGGCGKPSTRSDEHHRPERQRLPKTARNLSQKKKKRR